jgi:hypothetical protein
VPTRLSKEAMRKEIEQLHQNLYVRERILGALTSEISPDHVLEQLRNKVPVEEIVEQLEKTTASFRSSQSMQSEGMISETDRGPLGAEYSDNWMSQPSRSRDDMRMRPATGQPASDVSDDEAEAEHVYPAY